MSESINTRRGPSNFHRHLLASVSTAALIASAYVPSTALADDDADRPTVWIELGGQFEKIDTEQQAFSPPVFTPQPSFTTITPEQVQKPLDYSYGAEGKISFEPDGTDWVFSAAVRYGRSNGSKHVHQSTKLDPLPVVVSGQVAGYVTRTNAKFADATAKRSESHEVLDFQAGKDVGLGMFGNGSQSVVNFGVRFAQFDTAMHATLGMDPDNGGYKYIGSIAKIPTNDPHTFLGSVQSTRSFHGFGPTVSWDGSVPFAGSSDHAEFTFDWGANAAVLFGRQKTSIHHQTSAHTAPTGTRNVNRLITIYHHATDHVRSRSVAVPNVGGFAGASLRFSNAKVSLGYRADFFFGAMDGGIDTRQTENVGFHGPFATIGIGVGG